MRKALIAGAVATALFAVGAFAASFQVSSEDIASGSNAVESCAASATVDFTEQFDQADNNWDVSVATVTLVGGSDCNGADVQLVLQNNDGAESVVYDVTKGNIQNGINGVVLGGGNAVLTYSAVNVPLANVWNAAILVDGKQFPAT